MLVPAFPVGHASCLKPALQTANMTPSSSQPHRSIAALPLVKIERVKKKYHKTAAIGSCWCQTESMVTC